MSLKDEQSRIALLRAVAGSASPDSGQEGVFRAALEALAAAVGWPVGHVWLRRGAGPLVPGGYWVLPGGTPSAAMASFRQATESLAAPDTAGLVARAAAGGTARWAANLAREIDAGRQAAAGAAGLQSGLAVPITGAGEVVGVFEFFSQKRRRSSQTLLEVLDQAAVVLQLVLEREQVRASEAAHVRQVREILDLASDAFIGMDAAGRVTDWNRAANRMFGWTRDEAVGQVLSGLIMPDRYRAAHERGFRQILATGDVSRLGQVRELFAVDRTGQEFPIELTRWAQSADGETTFYGFARDATEREALRQRERVLVRDAHYDTLTGLPNRRLLAESLARVLQAADLRSGTLAVFFLDLDRFKRINDERGHAAGDEVLIAVAGRLRETFRPSDLVARLSGDEFVAVCANLASREEARAIAQRILVALANPIQIAGGSVQVSTSVGVTFADESSTSESLLEEADIAMYQAKVTGRGRTVVFDRQMRLRPVSPRLRADER